jgi:hypothetical protein
VVGSLAGLAAGGPGGRLGALRERSSLRGEQTGAVMAPGSGLGEDGRDQAERRKVEAGATNQWVASRSRETLKNRSTPGEWLRRETGVASPRSRTKSPTRRGDEAGFGLRSGTFVLRTSEEAKSRSERQWCPGWDAGPASGTEMGR